MLLNGVRVVEWAFGSVTGAFCARLLADLGADVVKLEPAGGDALRRATPALPLPDGRKESAFFAYLNSGKRTLLLSGGDSDDETVCSVAGTADILVVAPEPNDGARLLLRRIRKDQPRLVILQVSPFGLDAPQADIDSFASDMVLQHRSGLAYEHARPVENPAEQPPIGGADRELALAAGIAGAVACVSGLLARDNRAGAAPLLDLSKLDFAAHLCIDAFCASQRGQTAFPRARSEFGAVEVAGGLIWILECSDGWVMISPREQHQWDRWVEIIGKPDWAHESKFCGDRSARRANASEIQTLMTEWSHIRTKAEVFDLAQAGRVPCFPVSTAPDLLENAQLQHRGFFDRIETLAGPVMIPGLPFRLTTMSGAELAKARDLRVPASGSPQSVKLEV